MFLCLLILFSFFIFLLLIRILSLPFKIIDGLIDNLRQTRKKNIFKQLIKSLQYMIVGESSKAVKIIQNVLDNNQNLPADVEESLRLMFLRLDVGFNVKIHYMNKLLQSDVSRFKFFIARELAKLALQEKSYHYSLEFSLIAFGINNQDADLLELLIDVYATLESWSKMGEIIETLRNVDRNKFDLIKVKISTHYLKAAKQFIGLGELEESVFYLKKCLEYKIITYFLDFTKYFSMARMINP
jgi:tetratricopeptide (TPR) repeat protein